VKAINVDRERETKQFKKEKTLKPDRKRANGREQMAGRRVVGNEITTSRDGRPKLNDEMLKNVFHVEERVSERDSISFDHWLSTTH